MASSIFRDSEFIDFNTGKVKIPPMALARFLQEHGTADPADSVRFFQCKVDVWMLGVAVQILKEIELHRPPSIWSHAAYGLISVGFSYFEMIGKTLNPGSKKRRTAQPDFNYGFCDVYPEFALSLEEDKLVAMPEVSQYYDRIRNGMYHLGSTKFGLRIHNNSAISTKDFEHIGDDYCLNPHSMTRTIVEHFPGFIDRLIDPSSKYNQMRLKFREFLEDFHQP